jgi:hypothetical protein
LLTLHRNARNGCGGQFAGFSGQLDNLPAVGLLDYCVNICFCVGVASKISFFGHGCQFTPSDALFGSPFFAKAAIDCIIASDSCCRPAWLTVLLITSENSDGSKLPKMKGRSNACAAPYTMSHGAGSCAQLNW